MAVDKKHDFSGYATRNGLKCSDGRTIMGGAFKHMDGQKVPLVWQHQHGSHTNVLGYAILEHRDDGTYAYGFFNDTDAGKTAKMLVMHGDITALSIYANKLVQDRSGNVQHGDIREVSLVLSGANPGAFIDNVNLQHSDGEDVVLEAIIYTGLELTHSDADEEVVDELEDEDEADASDSSEDSEETEDSDLEHAGENMPDKTVKDVLDELTPEQRDVVYYMLGEAVKSNTVAHSESETADEASADSENSDEDTLNHASSEGNTMTRNVFDQTDTKQTKTYELSHSDIKGIIDNAKSLGSFKESVEDFALKHGIEDIEILFPDARAVTQTPDFLKRRTEWVARVLDGTRHTPFSRIKSLMADLTLDEARAKGYIKGNVKEEEFFRVSKRVTTPQTIYKKQKLDRDDIIDITDFDVVVWLKGEMRIMLEEEIARAVLFGDGRSLADNDKINEEHVRSIANDATLYQTTIYVNVDDANSSADEIVDAIVLNRRHYRGSGTPDFFTTEEMLAKLLLAKDTLGRRLYSTVQELAAAMRVNNIIAVEAMESVEDLVGIIVNLQDYTIGADKGGDVAMFDDFDIDYNQYKYLIETRISGALVKPKSALIIRKTAGAAVKTEPTAPTQEGNNVEIPTDAKVVYKNGSTGATLAQGSTVALSATARYLQVVATPASGYFFENSAEAEWTFAFEQDN